MSGTAARPVVPLDPAYIADLFGASARLRAAAPVHRVVTPEGEPAWLVTRYADVRAALADPALSLSNTRAHPGYRGTGLPAALAGHLLNLDPPDHTRLRKLLVSAFTTHRVDALHDTVRDTAAALLDDIAPRGAADLIECYIAPLTTTVICELLGVPTADRGDFRTWTHVLVDSAPDRELRLRDAVRNIFGYTRELVVRKRRAPAGDLLSALIEARDVDNRLSEDELSSIAFVLFAAGYETSMSLIGVGILELLRHPEIAAAVRADSASLPALVEELLRYCAPTALATRRFPVRDVEIGGVLIPAGDMVLLSLVSANHDPARFADADLLAPDRSERGHLAFGHGVHFCLGAPLARLEARIAIGTVLRRFPRLALARPDEPVGWRPSIRTHGVQRLHVTF